MQAYCVHLKYMCSVLLCNNAASHSSKPSTLGPGVYRSGRDRGSESAALSRSSNVERMEPRPKALCSYSSGAVDKNSILNDGTPLPWFSPLIEAPYLRKAVSSRPAV